MWLQKARIEVLRNADRNSELRGVLTVSSNLLKVSIAVDFYRSGHVRRGNRRVGIKPTATYIFMFKDTITLRGALYSAE